MIADLTIELLDRAYAAIAKVAKLPKPCISCGVPTRSRKRWVGVPGKGIGPACRKCHSSAVKLEI